MNTNMTGFRWSLLHPCSLDESRLSIGRVRLMDHLVHTLFIAGNAFQYLKSGSNKSGADLECKLISESIPENT